MTLTRRVVRDRAWTDREYDLEKYAELRRFAHGRAPLSYRDLRAHEWGSYDGVDAYADLFDRYIPPGARSICDLGAGYGFALAAIAERRPGQDVLLWGGDRSLNAQLLAETIGNVVRPFDFYDERYPILAFDECCPAVAVTVLTVDAIQQLPSAAPFLDALRRDRGRVREVVHFEPINTTAAEREYAERNDYNLDLISLLEGALDIEIDLRRESVWANNPLCPLSVVRWRFR